MSVSCEMSVSTVPRLTLEHLQGLAVALNGAVVVPCSIGGIPRSHERADLFLLLVGKDLLDLPKPRVPGLGGGNLRQGRQVELPGLRVSLLLEKCVTLLNERRDGRNQVGRGNEGLDILGARWSPRPGNGSSGPESR